MMMLLGVTDGQIEGMAMTDKGFTAAISSPPYEGVDRNKSHKGQSIEHKAELLDNADHADSTLKKMGGGARDIEIRLIEDSPIGPFIVVHLIYDVRDAMGANAINTACERLAPQIEAITGGKELALEYGYKPDSAGLVVAPLSDPRPEAKPKGNASVFEQHAAAQMEEF